MSIWFKHDAHFHEHPKCLRMRRLAGHKADSAEVGWWRIVAAAKRSKRWNFEDEDHLRDASGRYYGFVSIYRAVGLLDDLTIHDGEEYNSTLSGAERQAKFRHSRNEDAVTEVTPRVEKSREEKSRDARDVTDNVTRTPIERICDIWMSVRYRIPTDRQRAFLYAYLQTFDETGEARAERLILSNPHDPIAAMKADLAEFRGERVKALEAEEQKPRPARKGSGLTGINAEIAAVLRDIESKRGDAA